MEIRELYQAIVISVCRHTGVELDILFASNREECVDARAILVNVLLGKGITEREVVRLTGLTQQCVNKLKNNFSGRLRKWSVTTNLQAINNELTTG